jgi:hypothetical protein
LDEHGFYGKNETMKLRLLKEWNGKAPGKVGVFLSEYGEQMIKDGIAELLDESFVVEEMPQKQEVEQDTVYIPVPVPMSYFNDQKQEEGIIKPKKNK